MTHKENSYRHDGSCASGHRCIHQHHMALSNVRGQTEEVELVGYKNDRETKRSLLQQVITVGGPNGSVVNQMSDTRHPEV